MNNYKKRKPFPFPKLLFTIIVLIILASIGIYIFTTSINTKSNIKQETTEKNTNTKEKNKEPKKLHDNSDPNNILVLVNKDEGLPKDYKPKDLVVPNVKFPFVEDVDKRYIRKPAADALESLFHAGNKENIELYAVSGFRSYERQEEVYNNKKNNSSLEEANNLVAIPGHSEHQTGLAVDVSSKSANLALEESFEDTIEGKWLKENAHKYGFIIRYEKDKEHITEYDYEPWHIRFVGKEAAEEIYNSNITLEEYLGYYNPNKK